MQGFGIRHVLATTLVNGLVEAADEKQPSKTGTESYRLAHTRARAERTAAS